MAGHFELVTDPGGGCRVRLVDGHGKELAVSVPYRNSRDAAQGIKHLREIAGTALIEDHTSGTDRSVPAWRSRNGSASDHASRRAQ